MTMKECTDFVERVCGTESPAQTLETAVGISWVESDVQFLDESKIPAMHLHNWSHIFCLI